MQRPKRRRHKDNPYILNNIEEKGIYIVSFKDNKGKLQNIEINKEIYDMFDQFELNDLSEMNEYDNHIEHSEIYENNLNERAIHKPISVEQTVENIIINEKLKEAIDKLSEIQKRRIKMYYFENLTQQEIATREGTSLRAIQYTLNSAIVKLKEILKNL